MPCIITFDRKVNKYFARVSQDSTLTGEGYCLFAAVEDIEGKMESARSKSQTLRAKKAMENRREIEVLLVSQ